MFRLYEQIKEHNIPDCFSDAELKNIIHGTLNKRYALIKRALEKGELIRLKRGLYCLPEKFRSRSLNLFFIAQKIYGPSYVSLESALSYHDWIPESVRSVTSASSRRSRTFDTPVGVFSFDRVASKDFFAEVLRIQEGTEIIFIAKPWRAIADYVYVNRKDWVSVHPLIHSLRIEEDDLRKVTGTELENIAQAFGKRRISKFMKGVAKDLELL